MKKFNKFKIITCLIILKFHRNIFDSIYEQNYVITVFANFKLIPYKLLYNIYPDFRQYLNYWKPMLKRANNLSKLSILNIILYRKIKCLNLARYSKYV